MRLLQRSEALTENMSIAAATDAHDKGQARTIKLSEETTRRRAAGRRVGLKTKKAPRADRGAQMERSLLALGTAPDQRVLAVLSFQQASIDRRR